MKLVRSIAFCVAALGLSVTAVACGGTVEQPASTASALTKAPVGANTHGMVKVFGDALGEVSLRADQRVEIEKLASDAEARHAPQVEARKQLMLAFADQVEKGSIDTAALQPQIDGVTAGMEKTRDEDRAALTKLHSLLDADQRGAFVDALEKQMKAKREEHFGHGRMGGFAKLKQLGDDLKLTDDQRSQIRDALHGAGREAKEAWKEHAHEGGFARHEWNGEAPGKKAFEAFREDHFDFDKVAPKHDMKGMARFGTERINAVAQKVLPILTPEQRKIAADKIRAMAAAGDASLLGH